MTIAPKKDLYKAVEDAVFEDVKGILEGKPGSGMKARDYAISRWPDDSDPHHLVSRMLYVELAKVVGAMAIEVLLKKAIAADASKEAPSASAAE